MKGGADMEICLACPRGCSVNREHGERGFCGVSNEYVIGSAVLPTNAGLFVKMKIGRADYVFICHTAKSSLACISVNTASTRTHKTF